MIRTLGRVRLGSPANGAGRICATRATLLVVMATVGMVGPGEAVAQVDGSEAPFETPVPDDTLVRIDFADAPLADVARWVSAVTGRNLVIVPGDLDDARITVISARPVPATEVWALFVAALSTRGLTVQDRGSWSRIIEQTTR
jgi:type II secretory pathway component GspD/PulD (secretin)